jgi:hypothetical protein
MDEKKKTLMTILVVEKTYVDRNIFNYFGNGGACSRSCLETERLVQGDVSVTVT